MAKVKAFRRGYDGFACVMRDVDEVFEIEDPATVAKWAKPIGPDEKVEETPRPHRSGAPKGTRDMRESVI